MGVTSRPFHTRIEEHLDVKTKNSEKSAIKKHLNQCQKCFEDTRREGKQYFKILRHCENPYDAKIHEALLIKHKNPKLNKQQFNKGASFLLNVF